MEFLLKLQELLPLIAQTFMGIAILATLVVRIPGVGGDKEVDGVVGWIVKICAWLPTIGVNPNTKKLKEALEEAQAKK